MCLSIVKRKPAIAAGKGAVAAPSPSEKSGSSPKLPASSVSVVKKFLVFVPGDEKDVEVEKIQAS